MSWETKVKELEKRVSKLEGKKEDISWFRIGDLEWSENLGDMNWNEAMAKAKEIGARLPERWEMVKAVDEHYDEIQDLIEDDYSNNFWSATELSSTFAWFVYLNGGNTTIYSKSTASTYVRCVR
jgi:hypothetical protein